MALQNDTKTALLFCGILVGLLAIGFVVRGKMSSETPRDVAVIENGVQIIDIAAKGGYSPNVIQAQAGVPTELRLTTNGTYDCSSSVVIPALDYQKILPATGTETVALSADKAQGTLKGSCGMGMYRFEIVFR